MSYNIKLNLPKFDIRLRQVSGKTEVWDSIRKQWLVLTPEEWVRQNFIRYLTDYKNVDPMLIRQELGLKLHDTDRRADIVVYGRDAQPRMLVECKSPHIKISGSTLEQAARYNMTLRLPYLALTNGITHFCFKYDTAQGRLESLKEIPDFSCLCGIVDDL